MFVIRPALVKDQDDLLALAKQTFFINLPPDRDIIAHKIEQSQRSFASLAANQSRSSKPVPASAAPAPLPPASRAKKPSAQPSSPKPHAPAHRHASGLRAITGTSDLFLVVLENLQTKTVIGTSQVIARMGSHASPRHFMTLRQQSTMSKSLGLGWTHLVGTMGADTAGPTEIGGLILNHAFRGHPLHLGRFLSFARFHLIGLHRKAFADTIVAEMLGPITRTGYNPFYEKFTRHFITRPFNDVYRFSQTSREFLDTLMPRGDIFLSILDPEVANAAGEVSDDTRPARRLLERLGFEYHNRIDPLDGGPHLEAATDSVALIKNTRRVRDFQFATKFPRTKPATTLLASTLDDSGTFLAVQSAGTLSSTAVTLDAQYRSILTQARPLCRGITVLNHE